MFAMAKQAIPAECQSHPHSVCHSGHQRTRLCPDCHAIRRTTIRIAGAIGLFSGTEKARIVTSLTPGSDGTVTTESDEIRRMVPTQPLDSLQVRQLFNVLNSALDDGRSRSCAAAKD
jgi:hypothetical protein